MADKLVSVPQAVEMTGLSRSLLYVMIKDGRFPPPQRISARRVAWQESALLAWMRNLPTKRAA